MEIAARGACHGDDLAELSEEAIAELGRRDMSEISARTSETRLHLATMRQIVRVLQCASQGKPTPPILDRRREDGSAANG